MVVVVLTNEEAQAVIDYFDTIRVYGTATAGKNAAVRIANVYEAITRAQKIAKVVEEQVRREG